MIVGTAGHIDHGKTALIKALTGTDADRLPEEKSRGITIDLGFAYQHFDDGSAISFLDVPGHEKLVRTMLAGAIGIDFALLVVAADDGPMPQTHEHLAIIDLIGLKRGAIALTKIDRVSAERVSEVEQQITDLVGATALEDAPVIACSAHRGDGIDELARLLTDAAKSRSEQSHDGHFRLAIDRCFTLAGTGLVVTGTVHSGTVRTGDDLLLSPKGLDVRVRGLRCENQAADTAHIGQRCALNLTGRRVEKDDIARGDWIVARDVHAPTPRFDARLRLLPGESRGLAHWTPVHVHIGTSDILGRVSLLDAKRLSAGETALSQIVLDQPVCALSTDRFIIRDQAATRTLGGGRVVDPFPPQRRTRTPERLANLSAMERDNPGEALGSYCRAAPGGVDLEQFRISRNLETTALESLILEHDIVATSIGRRRVGTTKRHWGELEQKIIATLQSYQDANPDTSGASLAEVIRVFKDPHQRQLARERVIATVATGAIVRFGQLLHLPGHEIQLSSDDEVLGDEIKDILRSAGIDQPRVTVLAKKLGLRPDELIPSLEKLSRAGWLRRVSKAYFLLPETIDTFIARAQSCVATHPKNLLTVGQFREATGITRHLVMPLLEYFDRIGFTRRFDIGRQIRREWLEENSNEQT